VRLFHGKERLEARGETKKSDFLPRPKVYNAKKPPSEAGISSEGEPREGNFDSEVSEDRYTV